MPRGIAGFPDQNVTESVRFDSAVVFLFFLNLACTSFDLNSHIN